MTKAREFAEQVAGNTVYTANTVQRVMEEIAYQLYLQLNDGNVVHFPGVGKFYPKLVPPKKFTNPRTKQKGISKARKIAAFTPLPRKKILG